jgi:hypothetical protein
MSSKSIKLLVENWRSFLDEVKISDYKNAAETIGSTHPIYKGSYNDKNYYMKFPDNELQTLSEYLSYRIYSLYDAKIPESFHLVFDDDNLVGISTEAFNGKIFRIRRRGTDQHLIDAFTSNLGNMYYIDAFLANWDAAGNVVVDFDKYENEKEFDYRMIDPGGALNFRAQGALKGRMFGDEVGELDTLLDPVMSRGTGGYKVYGNRDDNVARQKFLNVSWSEISSMIEETKQEVLLELSENDRNDLKDEFAKMCNEIKTKLEKRHNYIMNKIS